MTTRSSISLARELSATPLLVGCSVSPTFLPAFEMVLEALQARHPQMGEDARLDMIFLRGIVGLTDDFNLPRVGSNPDTDA